MINEDDFRNERLDNMEPMLREIVKVRNYEVDYGKDLYVLDILVRFYGDDEDLTLLKAGKYTDDWEIVDFTISDMFERFILTEHWGAIVDRALELL